MVMDCKSATSEDEGLTIAPVDLQSDGKRYICGGGLQIRHEQGQSPLPEDL